MWDTGLKNQSAALNKTTEVVMAQICEGRRQAAATMLTEKADQFSQVGTERLKKIATS